MRRPDAVNQTSRYGERDSTRGKVVAFVAATYSSYRRGLSCIQNPPIQNGSA